MKLIFLLLALGSTLMNQRQTAEKSNGYKGIWFELDQKYEHGDKYSGGLGTYTAKHHPLAIYSEKANKTFFVYGGTTSPDKRELLVMISYYDHETGLVPKPTIVYQKPNVNDPHDNPSLAIDSNGHLWVFISGRGRIRPGYIYRSTTPFSINTFEQIKEGEFAYPQPWFVDDKGFLFLFTKYTDGRELYWTTSRDGRAWTASRKLARGGHYQMSNCRDGRVITAFNSHLDGVDTRTNLYFIQSHDMGETWKTVDGRTVSTPLAGMKNPALVRDYQAENRLVYLKDIQFDDNGNPVLLYITSSSHKPGPDGEPRYWTLAHWKESEWQYFGITRATHNYDMGSLYIEDDAWKLIAPTEPGPQYWGAGGEMALWTSEDDGATWSKKVLTHFSEFNHAYARRPVNAQPDFYTFWADGHADSFSVSRLYYTNATGDGVWQLPYEMETDVAQSRILEEPLRHIGRIEHRHARDIRSSQLSIGCETLDRDYWDYQSAKDYLGALGAKKARLQGGWAKCEPEQGVYYFDWLDDVVFDIRSQGVTPWIQLSYGNPIYEGGGSIRRDGGLPIGSDKALAAWLQWTQKMVERYHNQVWGWEIWNEFNWAGIDVSDYTSFYIQTAETVRAVDPQARLIACSMAGLAIDKVDSFLSQLKQQNKLHLVDVITFHGYPINPDDLYRQLPELREVVGNYDSGILLMQGESGAPSTHRTTGALNSQRFTEIKQAKWDLRRWLGDLGHGLPSNLFLLSEFVYPDGRNTKGLLRLRSDTTFTITYAKPAYCACRNVTALFDDSMENVNDIVFSSSHPLDNLALYCFQHKSTQDKIFAVWRKNLLCSDDPNPIITDITLHQVMFRHPVYVDLLTGYVYEIDDNLWAQHRDSATFYIRITESPILIAERKLISMTEK